MSILILSVEFKLIHFFVIEKKWLRNSSNRFYFLHIEITRADKTGVVASDVVYGLWGVNVEAAIFFGRTYY